MHTTAVATAAPARLGEGMTWIHALTIWRSADTRTTARRQKGDAVDVQKLDYIGADAALHVLCTNQLSAELFAFLAPQQARCRPP